MKTAYSTDFAFAKNADENDPLKIYRNAFYFPTIHNKAAIYFCGNSLGLQPKKAATIIETELASWRSHAIEGFFTGTHPWLYYQEYLKPALAKIMGCLPHEVTVMNTLTVNLHLLLLSFYKPDTKKFKIIMEAGAFPSDQYAVETLVKHFGLDPATTIIEIEPKPGNKTLQTKDIIDTIEKNAGQLALVLIGGIQYYTGQLFDIKAITAITHKAGAVAAFDLAHVAGNVPVQLHEWNVDFAVWCSYKYLNGGPGAIGGIYIHEQYATDINFPRLGGWWGNDEQERFKMEKGFKPKNNASGWNISTTQVMNTAALMASLEIFEAAGMDAIRRKSIALTGYLDFLLKQLPGIGFEMITPAAPEERGAQLSLYFKENGKTIHSKMLEKGIIVDFREPGVIRIAPAPLYCSFQDIFAFYEILKNEF
ncbi:kynureninase [Hydrotalea lipotrueae]|uniref:kynureninase n=1 Tax=Hydrotalea lipotrueae TaxID=2803817 RepID=UPI001C439497|nr:kynureninase [Hydrotalea lipotrueae]